MKRLVAITLIACVLVSTTELCQLLKMPKLIEHFIQHRKQNSAMSFQAFLSLHYWVDHGMDADYKEDMQLPFKSFRISVNPNYLGFITQHICYIPSQTFSDVKERIKIINDELPDFSVYNAIWHPPSLS